MARRVARGGDSAEICGCFHSKSEHEQNRATLQRTGPCRALNVTEKPSGEREVKQCSCSAFALKHEDDSGPCRHCEKPKHNHRGTIGHSYEAKG